MRSGVSAVTLSQYAPGFGLSIAAAASDGSLRTQSMIGDRTRSILEKLLELQRGDLIQKSMMGSSNRADKVSVADRSRIGSTSASSAGSFDAHAHFEHDGSLPLLCNGILGAEASVNSMFSAALAATGAWSEIRSAAHTMSRLATIGNFHQNARLASLVASFWGRSVDFRTPLATSQTAKPRAG